MTAEDLDKLLKQKESTTLEFKLKIERSARIARTLAAFANTAGGLLLVGVDDDKHVKGCSELVEMTKIMEAAEDWVIPPLSIQYEAIAWGEGPIKRTVLVIYVAESDEKPHKVRTEKGEELVYMRANDESTPISKDMIHVLEKPDQTTDLAILQQAHVKYLLMYLRKQRKITAKEYAKLVNISVYRASKLLEYLTYTGVLLMLSRQKPAQFVLRK